MESTIRRASMDDARAIRALNVQLGYDLPEEALRARLERIIARDDHAFFIAERGHAAAGWAHAALMEFLESGPVAVIGGLVVDVRARRTGVGGALMRRVESWAAEQSAPVVRLWSSAGRTEAHRFYEKIGYTRAKTQFAFLKILDASAPVSLESFVPTLRE